VPYAVSAAPPPQGIHLPAGVTVTSPWGRLGAYLLESVLVFVTLGIGWVIWAMTTAGNGQTPAKRLLGQRVIGADTLSPVGMGKMFWMRGFVAGLVAWFAIVFTLGIILFMPFWDKRNQNLWDKVSNTYVVNDSVDAWGRKPDLRR
jgi:uncharacterized RDD family membrane protein YckC